MTSHDDNNLLELIKKPLEGEVCGEDPRYNERFAHAKMEIEKLSGADFKLVRTLCGDLLATETKDLRLLGYLALAATYENGVSGLTDVCRGYSHVVREWWDHCHPRRENARVTAIKWLNNPRFIAFLERAQDGSDPGALKALNKAVNELDSLMAERFADQPPQWSELQKWMRNRQKLEGQSTSRKGASLESASDRTRGVIGKVGSDKELNKASREIIGYLRQQGDYGRMVAFARALRWGGLIMPPNEEGTTRIPAPRQAALAEVEAAMEQDAWLDAFLACEAVFMEPGGQFSLQLQQWAELAAERMGQAHVAQLISDQARHLLQRLPALAELRYENGAPFAAPGSLDWVESLTRRSAGTELATDSDKEWSKCEQSAREVATEKGLAAGLMIIDDYRAKTGRAIAQVQLGKAQLCLAQGRGDLALPVLDGLGERIDREQAVVWAPEFALQVWRAQQKALRSAGKQCGMTETEIKKRLAEVKANICKTDLNAAAAQF